MGRIFSLLLAVLSGLGGLFILVNWFRHYRAGRFTQEGEKRAEREAVKELMENPKFRAAELEVGRRFPHAIRNLYARKDLLTQTDFYFLDPVENGSAWSIESFLPVTPQTIRGCWPQIGGACYFARTREYFYYVPFDSDPYAPTSVFVFNCLTGEHVKVSESLNDFLNWPRISAAKYHKHHARVL